MVVLPLRNGPERTRSPASSPKHPNSRYVEEGVVVGGAVEGDCAAKGDPVVAAVVVGAGVDGERPLFLKFETATCTAGVIGHCVVRFLVAYVVVAGGGGEASSVSRSHSQADFYSF